MKLSVTKMATALALVVSMGVFASPASAAEKKQYVFGAGSPGGTWEMLGTGICKVLNKYASYELLPTTSTTINQVPPALNDNEMALAIGSPGIFEPAVKGEGVFKGHPAPNFFQVMSIYDNILGYMVLGSSKIRSAEDFTDSTIIACTPGNVPMVNSHLEEMKKAGILKADNEVLMKKLRRMTYAQIWDQLNDSNIDVAYVTGFPYNGGVDSLVSTKKARFIGVSTDPAKVETFRKAFDKANPDIAMLPIPKGMYATTAEDVWGPVSYTLIYAAKATPDEVVMEFIDLTIKHMKEIALVHPSASQISLEVNKRNIDSGLMLPNRLHPGAIKYFKKMGIIK